MVEAWWPVNLQVLGYGWAGLLRKYVVEPAHMWWPGTLVQVSLFRYVVRTRRLYSFHWILDTHALLTQQFFFFFSYIYIYIYIFVKTLFKGTKLSIFLKEDTLI
jgi:hypothetical protein